MCTNHNPLNGASLRDHRIQGNGQGPPREAFIAHRMDPATIAIPSCTPRCVLTVPSLSSMPLPSFNHCRRQGRGPETVNDLKRIMHRTGCHITRVIIAPASIRLPEYRPIECRDKVPPTRYLDPVYTGPFRGMHPSGFSHDNVTDPRCLEEGTAHIKGV